MYRLLLLSAIIGCSGFPADHGNCPRTGKFVPGTYVSSGGHWENGSGTYPHASASAKTLTLERAPDGNGIVRIVYKRGAHTIVETWQGDPDFTRVTPFPWEKGPTRPN